MAAVTSYGSAARQVLVLCFSLLLYSASVHAQNAQSYLIGRGIADVTGPAVGVMLWGFGHPDQVGEGIHIRQRSRAFIMVQADDLNSRLVLVSADLGSIDHHILWRSLSGCRSALVRATI